MDTNEPEAPFKGRREEIPVLYRQQGSQRVGPGRVDLRSVGFFGGMLVLIALAGALYLQEASQVASYAHEIRMLQSEQEQLHLEITALRADIAMQGSLARILSKGQELGYQLVASSDSTHRLWLQYQGLPTPQSTAVASEPSEELESEGASPEDSPGLWQRLMNEVNAWLHGEPGN